MGLAIWNKCLSRLEDELTSQEYNTWIRPLQAERDTNNLRLLAPNKYIRDEVQTEFLPRIEQLAFEFDVTDVSLDIGTQKTDGESPVEPAGGQDSIQSPRIALKKEFTFGSFVEGRSNELARAAAQYVSENVGKDYNPLLLYGGVGLGKTHLMHAIGNAIKERNADAKVNYMYAQNFTEEMVKSIELGRMPQFTGYYRSIDVLLIDDIHFLAKGVKSQEEFFHIFNHLQEHGRQIVLTCDRYPKEVDGLEERLKSRFVWGMTAPIEPPELETRVAILMRKAQSKRIELPKDVAFFIAERIRSNVRELEGALKRVIARARFTGRRVSKEIVRETLKDLLAIQDRQLSIENIQRAIADYYSVRVVDLNSKRRNRSIARPRQLAMALAKELTNLSYPEIGDRFGGRDHSTVLYACRKIDELKESDGDMQNDYNQLLRILTT